jgi:hypothetical protein
MEGRALKTTVHKIKLRSEQHFHAKLPPYHLGRLLAEIPLAVRESISMALRNRSTAQGRRPAWLERAADIRFADHQGNGETILFFEAPVLGEAAQEIYTQTSLFPEMRPDPNDTGFDLLGDVLVEVDQRNADSQHFDPALLKRVTHFQSVFGKKSPFSEFEIETRHARDHHWVKVNPATVESANSLLGRTPTPQRIRLVGQLDGLEASTQRFSVLLDSGEKITGVFAEDQIDAMQELWRQRVLVLGTAVYRASGRLLRIDADSVRPGEDEPMIFSHLPAASHKRLDASKLHKPQGLRSGIAAIIGQWPGDETNEEVIAGLEKLS